MSCSSVPASWRFCITVLLVIAVAATADAQDTGWFRYGAFSMTPSIALTNFGQDGNVFNETVNPKHDLSATVQPAADAAMRIGRGNVRWSGRVDALMFKEYSDQNTLSAWNVARLEVPLTRMTLFTGLSYVNARERPTADIDVRARRHELLTTAGLTYQLGAVTALGVTGDLGSMSFDRGDVTDGGVPLGFVLDRSSRHLGVTVQRSITSLTSVVGSVDFQRDVFESGINRQTTTRRLTGGLSFKPFALISGNFNVGVLSVLSARGLTPPKRSPTMAADLGYTLLGNTHFSTRVDRSVTYSIEDRLSYTLQTGISGAVTHHLRDAIAVSGSVSRQHLDYEPTAQGLVEGLDESRLAPSAVIATYDAALSYRQRTGMTVGLHVSYTTRSSSGIATVPGYNNFRLFTSVSYVPQH